MILSNLVLQYVEGGLHKLRTSQPYSSCQATQHIQQCAEFLPLRNRGFGPLAVTVLPIPLAGRAAATLCAAV
jgi:hypothetical protein